MRRILTEPGVAKIRRFGLGNILNWEILLAEIDKSLGCLEKKHLGYFAQRTKKKKKKEQKKKNARKLLRKLYYKSGLIYDTIDWNWINWEASL